MKNIQKIVITLLVSFGLMTSASAGTLEVTGTAKATYNTLGNIDSQGRTLGLTNELNFGASGELDNGFTWVYSMELDPANTADGGAALNDDSSLKVTTGYGTIGVCISECGLSAALNFSQDAYSLMSDTGYAEGKIEPKNISSYSNFSYATPADLLPFGVVIKAGYAPNGSTTTNSGNASVATSTTVKDVEMYRIEAEPIDGLDISASYLETGLGSNSKANEQQEVGYAAAIKYSVGNVSLGFGKSVAEPAVLDDAAETTARMYENTNYSIGYAFNDALSLSYTAEESKKNNLSGSVANDLEVASYQAAYTMGGMTLAIARTDYDNVAYVNNDDATETVFAVTMAF